MNSSLQAASLAIPGNRSYAKDISQWVGKWALPALWLFICFGQIETCDWHRSELW